MVDLLTTKMNALYQEFYGLDNLKSRDMVQIQISDTYDKLSQGRDRFRPGQEGFRGFPGPEEKDQTPAIWIK